MRSRDFEIPVSWGHISGVTWGKSTRFPVLCVHGIQDNAGTFDRLIPLLPKRFFWVSIDLPGHGKSSHFESGHHIEYTHLLYAIKTVVDHFKWTKLYLLGHSLGAQLSTFFSSVYPELVVKCALIDGLITTVTPEEKYVSALRRKFDNNERLEVSLLYKTPPSYSYEAAVDRLIRSRANPLSTEGAKVLVKRSLMVSGDGFRYSTDQRFKLITAPLITLGQIINIVESIKCPVLLIIAEESLKKMREGAFSYFSADVLSGLDAFPNFTYKVIPGHHDVHLNNPESVAALIAPFLDDTKSSL